MLLMVQQRLRQVRDDDRGAGLVAVVALMVFAFVAASVVGSSSIFITRQTVNDVSRLQALAAAEAGRDYTLSQISTGCITPFFTGSNPRFDTVVYPTSSAEANADGLGAGCPSNADEYVVIRSEGRASDGTDLVIDSTYRVLRGSSSGINGAIIAGGGDTNLSRLTVTGSNANIVQLSGSFDCNSSSDIAGASIIRNGSVQVTNYCKIGGDVMATGTVNLDSYGSVGGSVVSRGGVTMSNNSKVGLDVRARGAFTMNNTTSVGGSATAVGTGESSVNGTIGTNLWVAGKITLSADAKVGGNVVSSNSATAMLFPTAKVSGYVHLRGDYSTWSGGPTVGGGITKNMSAALTPQPTWEDPEEFSSAELVWKDYAYVRSDWSGYTERTLTNCSFTGSGNANVAMVNALTTPTVIDARSCSKVDLTKTSASVTLNLRTDVAIIGNAFSAQGLNVNSANGDDHLFHMITPDTVDNDVPSCVGSAGASTIYDGNTDSHITGFVYTPCKLSIGNNSHWRGQLYAGSIASGGSMMTLDYVQSAVPGFPGASGGGSSTGATVDTNTLVNQAER